MNIRKSPNRRHDMQYFYKYVSSDTAKIIIANRRLRWSSPIQFNDPFDVTQELRLDFDADQLTRTMNHEFADLVERGEAVKLSHPVLSQLFDLVISLDEKARKAFAKEFRDESTSNSTAGQKNALEELRQMWRGIVPDLRVLCLSERNDVTAMWNHYANSYRGVVLQFEAVDEVDSGFLMARQVTYQDELPEIADARVWAQCLLGVSDVSYKDLITDLQYIKTTDWSYEKEWRIVSYARRGESATHADYAFHPKELAGVCFGSKCTKADADEIAALLTHGLEHVSVCKAIADDRVGKFRIVPMS